MKIKVLIIEDEQDNIDILVHFLEKYCDTVGEVEYALDIEEGISKFKSFEPDVLLLDIKLSQGTSFDFLELLGEINVPIIFVTAYDEFAIKAIKYSAVDYLLKPVRIADLREAIAKATTRISKETSAERLDILKQRMNGSSSSNDEFIAIPTVESIEFVRAEDILTIEADGKYSSFEILDADAVVSSRNLGEYEELLEPAGFFRVHHSYLVNLNQILRISKLDGLYCVMKNGKSIPVSRRKKEELMTRLKVK